MRRHLPLTLGLVALALAAAVPWFVRSFTVSVLTTALIFAILSIGLAFLVGHAGLPSLGHAASFGLGAYGLALSHLAGLRIGAAFVVGVAVATGFAMVVGPILLRTRGVYFLMATVAVAEVLRNIAISWRDFTGGDDGLSGIRAPTVLGLDLGDHTVMYLLCLALTALGIVHLRGLARSPYGHALRAVRDNRARGQVIGLAATRLEYGAMVVSGFYAGLAGSIFALHNGFVAPATLSVRISGTSLLMVIVGGSTSFPGVAFGAVAVESLRAFSSLYTGRWMLLVGALYAIVALAIVRDLGSVRAWIAPHLPPVLRFWTGGAQDADPGGSAATESPAAEDRVVR